MDGFLPISLFLQKRSVILRKKPEKAIISKREILIWLPLSILIFIVGVPCIGICIPSNISSRMQEHPSLYYERAVFFDLIWLAIAGLQWLIKDKRQFKLCSLLVCIVSILLMACSFSKQNDWQKVYLYASRILAVDLIWAMNAFVLRVMKNEKMFIRMTIAVIILSFSFMFINRMFQFCHDLH